MDKILRTDNIEIYKGAEYRVVRGYPDYLVSEYGVIIHKEKGFVKQSSDKLGYKYAQLKDSNGVRKRWLIHRFVATAWIENPTRKPTVNHIDGVKWNNTIENLEWATMKEQIRHAHDTGLIVHKKGEEHWAFGIILSPEQRKKMSEAKLGERHPKFKGYYVTPLGMFSDIRSAGKAHGWSGMYFRVKFTKHILNKTEGWYFDGVYSSTQIEKEKQLQKLKLENKEKRDIEKRRKMSEAKIGENHPKFKGWYITPLGRFSSLEEGAVAYGISRAGFMQKFIKNAKWKKIDGWAFEDKVQHEVERL